MPQFENVRDGLNYCIEQLMPRRHKYIVDILGAREAAADKSHTLQVVAQHLVIDDGDPGLAMHLPIDPAAPESAAFMKYLDTNFAGLYQPLPLGPITTTVVRFGRDVDGVCRLVDMMMQKIFQYPADAAYAVTVHDEGAIEEKPEA